VNSSELGAPAFACVVALGVLSGIISFSVFKRFTDSDRVRQTVNRIVAHLFEIRLFSDEPVLVLRAQRDLIVENGRLLVQFAKPSFILFVPFAILLAAMDPFFGHAPLRAGETTLITKPDIPRGFEVTGPPVYVQAEHRTVWEISATKDGLRGFSKPATVFHVHWMWWFAAASLIGLLSVRLLRPVGMASLAFLLLLTGCQYTQVIVLGVDGMDPAFVERHWDALPNLKSLRDRGYFGRLRTTNPPQSPVAWSTFITGLDPDQHGIYDFVERDPVTLALFSSMSKMDEPKYALPLGPYLLPLSSAHIYIPRQGTPFWRTLVDKGVSTIVQRIPVNYPPEAAGIALSGMGTPDLLGTLGTFTFFTDDPVETAREVSGGRIIKTQVSNGRAELRIEGPPNPLRKDHAVTATTMTVDVDPTNDAARIKLGDQAILIRQGAWSPWLAAEFPLISHISGVQGMVRVFAKQLHPGFEIYVSPVNLDPEEPALPISFPGGWARETANDLGRFGTLGIPEDTSALRQGVFSLPEFRQQAELAFEEESKLLDYSLHELSQSYFFFFYVSSVDQNSHVLWGKHEDELLKVYREIDACVGRVRRTKPHATLMIISDHGFTTFDRAVHLNTWLKQNGFSDKAYAVGLNGLYVRRAVTDKDALLEKLREQLLAWHDLDSGRQVITSVFRTHPAAANQNIAPDLLIGYAAGYRASWQTGLGEAPPNLIEYNNDAWIGDHCVDPNVVPGVLFSSEKIQPNEPRLQDVTASILKRFGIPPPQGYKGRPF